MKEIGKVKRLDEFLTIKRNSSKSKDKSVTSSRTQQAETLNQESSFALIKGTIARTDRVSGLPHLDELTHHLISVATASLKFNSPETTLAALIHDYYKPVFDFRKENRWKWYHYITNQKTYVQLLSEFKDSINVFNVARISQWHHPNYKTRECNEICQIENSKLISALETSLPFALPQRDDYVIIQHLRVPGKYRVFLLALLKEMLSRELSKEYAKRFQKILGVSRIRYEYRPVQGLRRVEDVGKLIQENDWKIEIKENTMIIPLPSRFHKEVFYFEYYEGSEIVLDVDTKARMIRGVKVPFGMALSTIYFAGAQDAYLVYVDAGNGLLPLDALLGALIEDLKRSLSKNKQKTAFNSIDISKITMSLTGEFESDTMCVFCGEPGESISDNEKVKSIMANKFTDTWLLLTHGASVCPACKLGFEIEELFRAQGMNKYLAEEAILEMRLISTEIPIFRSENFLRSISSKIWLELLSEVYYSLHKSKELQKITKKNEWTTAFYLNPKVVIYPYIADMTPQVLSVALRYSKKKFVLQSGIHSRVVFPGNEKDMTSEEFAIVRKFYSSHPSIGLNLVHRIKSVYNPIFGVPKVAIQRGGGSRARKRKS
ncbi:hypothetical protein [Thermococcus pacificus]|uniref:HD domain-containing protein n=1 Tax=Thermococcus pacificus TaxID=71998 RepID=A0A218P7B0_9EURY|nr:hypothetical protein [Thermococcus pacificus]ASJ06667.1 hypothetical protein A3L08_04680 [Thermococcus pacificus]